MTEREEMLEDIRRVASQLDKNWVSSSEYRRYGRFSGGKVLAVFVRWNNAVDAAGLEAVPPGTNAFTPTGEYTNTRRISDEELCVEFMRVYTQLGRVPSTREFGKMSRFSTTVYRRRFGSWREVVRHCVGTEAVFEVQDKVVKIPDEELRAEFMRVYTQLGRVPSTTEFGKMSRFSTSVYLTRFGSWREVIRHCVGTEAVFEVQDKVVKIPDEELRAEFMRVHGELGKVPTIYEFGKIARFSAGTYRARFGGWRETKAHYLGAKEPPPLPLTRQQRKTTPSTISDRRRPRPGFSPNVNSGRRVFGPPLNFRELRHEPVDEQGVVFLFGMVARELEFLVDAVGTGFPDCRAKRRIKGGRYIEVDIEFEFRSSNFRVHGHDPTKCGLIVCWENDWLGCPIEVLELKTAIRQLNANV